MQTGDSWDLFVQYWEGTNDYSPSNADSASKESHATKVRRISVQTTEGPCPPINEQGKDRNEPPSEMQKSLLAFFWDDVASPVFAAQIEVMLSCPSGGNFGDSIRNDLSSWTL
jgi:hypothetical protein